MNRISETTDIPVGISACVMGEEVRFNGGHSQSRICQNQLAKHFKFQPFCPEVAAGFGQSFSYSTNVHIECAVML